MRCGPGHFGSCAGVGLIVAAAMPASSAPVGFLGDQPGCAAAVGSLPAAIPTVEDFEGFTTGTVFGDGTVAGGLTYGFAPGGLDGVIRGIGGISGDRTLAARFAGSTGLFGIGDAVTFSFAPSYAFGAWVVLPQDGFDLFDDDINLTAGGLTISNLASGSGSDVNGVFAFFVGIVDADVPFTSASLRFGPEAGGSFTGIGEIDDVSLALVPLPAAAWMFGAGLLGLGWLRRRRSG